MRGSLGRSSRRSEDARRRYEWRAAYFQTPRGRLTRLRGRLIENERRRQRRQAERAARRVETPEQELARLIAEQARDARRYLIKFGPNLDYSGRRVA